MCTEIQLLLLNSCLHGNTINDILLRSVLDSDKSKSQLHIFTLEHTFSVGTFVHNVNLCDNTNSSNTLWIKLTGHLQTVWGSHICVGWQHAKNDCSWVTAVPGSHTFCYFFNHGILSINWDSCNTRKIDHGKIWASVRINIENDWFINDILLLSTNLICQKVNCLFDLLKVGEFLIWYLFKLCPRFNIFWSMIQSQFKWSSRNDTLLKYKT